MIHLYISSVVFFGSLQYILADDLSCSGDSVFSRLSAYNPLNATSTEFTTLDFHGQSLKTLQDYLNGLTAYVTVAMDSNLLDHQIPYGTVVCIPTLNEKYGKKIRFEVRDTRPDLDGLGFNRASICVGSPDDLADKSVNSLVNMRLPSGTIKDEDETEELGDKNLIVDADAVNYPGLREDYSAQKRDQYGSSNFYYPPYYYHPAPEKTTTTEKPYYYPYYYYPEHPKTTTEKPHYYPYYYYPEHPKTTTEKSHYYPYYYYPEPPKTTTEKPKHPYPYPYPPYPYYPPYSQYPPYPYYEPPKATTSTEKPYYPPANAYYYYPYYKNPTSNNMYGYSNNYYNVSYDSPTPNYKPMAISNTHAPQPPSYGHYPSYYAPQPSSNNHESNSNSRPY